MVGPELVIAKRGRAVIVSGPRIKSWIKTWVKSRVKSGGKRSRGKGRTSSGSPRRRGALR